MAERLCTGLQIRVDRFDSGLRLQDFQRLTYLYVGLFVLGVNKTSTPDYTQESHKGC